MSIGGEDVKGTDLTKEVFKMLKRSELNFRGNIEGHDLFAHPVEVVVCDGFVGNVILKTCESVGDAIFKWLKHELTKAKSGWPAPSWRKNAFQGDPRKSELRGIRRLAAPRRERHLHHRARGEHSARDQECAAGRGRVD